MKMTVLSTGGNLPAQKARRKLTLALTAYDDAKKGRQAVYDRWTRTSSMTTSSVPSPPLTTPT